MSSVWAVLLEVTVGTRAPDTCAYGQAPWRASRDDRRPLPRTSPSRRSPTGASPAVSRAAKRPRGVTAVRSLPAKTAGAPGRRGPPPPACPPIGQAPLSPGSSRRYELSSPRKARPCQAPRCARPFLSSDRLGQVRGFRHGERRGEAGPQNPDPASSHTAPRDLSARFSFFWIMGLHP